MDEFRHLNFVVSFSLFKRKSGFEYYHRCCVKMICGFRDAFQGWGLRCSFVAHVSDSIEDCFLEDLQLAGGGRVTVIKYRSSSGGKHGQSGFAWLVGAMRFRTLWEKRREGDVVIVCDVHDQVDLVLAKVREILGRMQRMGKDICHTFWETTDPFCIEHCALPVSAGARFKQGVEVGRNHCHSDGGLLIWKYNRQVIAHLQRSQVSFIKFVASKVQNAVRIPRGVDEMLLDMYLQEGRVYQAFSPSVFLFLKHEHEMVPNVTEEWDAFATCDNLDQGAAISASMVTIPVAPMRYSHIFCCSERIDP